jgi:hypothetical protein
MPPTTAAICPDAFSDNLAFAMRRTTAFALVAIFLLVGFFLRTNQLGAESLGEDELNKLQTVAEYRTDGLSGKNGEHPFLMKGLQTASVVAAERWNSVSAVTISTEAALRFPLALFGTFSILLIFLLTSALFGRSIGIVAAGLYALEPMAIGFDRIAKEDSLVVFYFLLAQILWVRSQAAAQREDSNWVWYAWGSAAAFAGLMASKYYPHLLAITGAYYNVFKYVPSNRWHMQAKRWLIFFLVMGFTFLILNPTILLPETWREMLKFSSENRIGHDSYEFMGVLYPNQMTAWLSGVPWTFYYVFIAVKTSLTTLLFLLIGLQAMFRRKMGDGRFLVFFWAFMWFLPFTFLGGKFTRYFAFVTPLLCIVAAAGFCFAVKWLLGKLRVNGRVRPVLEFAMLACLIAVPLINSLSSAPHYRMFTNVIGGGKMAGGAYFPHDEFYDGTTEQAMKLIANYAAQGAAVASETPGLYAFYGERHGRPDLRFVSLSDKSEVNRLSKNDFVVLAKGRRYFSNAAYYNYLQQEQWTTAEFDLGGVPAVSVYVLDDAAAESLRALSP